MNSKDLLIGFIGQGFVGKNYANDFEKRGYNIVRYALEEPYRDNKDKIKDCDIVFIAVPTPTRKNGFDLSIVENALGLIGKGKIAVIKSTILPGMTRMLQKKFPRIIILFSPEFLNVSTAAHDAANPFSNIVGLPSKTAKHKDAAEAVHSVLPHAPFKHISTSEEAELYKYAHNVSGFMQVLTYNMMYDVARHYGADWNAILPALEADPMISNWYIRPIHKSGRGAGGACFIKDFAAFAKLYRDTVGKKEGIALLKAAEKKNIMLLLGTNKDLDLLEGVYGPSIVKKSPAKKKAPKSAKKR